MDTVYKLTNQDNTTYNKTRWGEGVTHRGTGEGELCGPGFIHAYTHPLLAVLLNPIHGNLVNPKLWRCETVIVKNDRGLKVGGVELTTIEEIPLPIVTTHQRVLFAFLCCKEFKLPGWDECLLLVRQKDYYAAYAAADAAAYDAAAAADDAAARAAAVAAYAAADAAARAAADATAYAAAATAATAYAAADAATAYAAADAAYAAYAARAARAATAYAAARAARAVAARAAFDLISIAKEACRG